MRTPCSSWGSSNLKKRLIVFCLGAILVAVVWSPTLHAHKDPSHHAAAWPAVRPMNETDPFLIPGDETKDVTFLIRPIRVDLDREPPGRHEEKAVRFHMRSLTRGEETTVSFERPLFASDDEMVRFHRSLQPLMRAPILSVRVQVATDEESPSWNRRHRAVRLPDWVEIPAR